MFFLSLWVLFCSFSLMVPIDIRYDFSDMGSTDCESVAYKVRYEGEHRPNVLTGIALCYPHTHSVPDLVIVIGNVAVLLNFIPNQMFSWKGKFVSKLCNIRWPWAPTELSVLRVFCCNLDLNWSFKHNENVALIKTSWTLCQKAHLWSIWFYVGMSGVLAFRWLATCCSQCCHLLRTFTCRNTRKSGVADSGAKMDKVETPASRKELILPHLIIHYPVQYYLLIAVNAPRRVIACRLFDRVIVYLICSDAYWTKIQPQRSYASYNLNFKLAE